MKAPMKNVNKEHKEELSVRKDVARYELRINSQTHDLDNSLPRIEKEYNKSNARSVQIFELSPAGDKKLIKNKFQPATEKSIKEQMGAAVQSSQVTKKAA